MNVRLLCLSTLVFTAAAYAQPAPVPSLFAGAEPMAVAIAGPLNEIARDRAAEPAYRSATLIWTDTAGVEVRIPLQIRPRGKSRRAKTACRFPPLRLNFAKHTAAGTPFSDLHKVKLVTHCGPLTDASPAYADRLRLELLLYRVFNRISPASFRIRPLDITYIETDNDNHKTTHPGFLIEPEEMLAARLGAKPTNVTAITPEQLEPVQANLVEVFQYLAGNTDFSMVRGPAGEHCCHNIVLLAPPSGPLLPVPYDFDATGVVDPPYAAPALSLHIRDVRQRLYRGYCRPAPALAATLATFRAARADIYALFRGDARLHPGAIDSATTYLDGFYAVIDQPAALQAKVVARCL